MCTRDSQVHLYSLECEREQAPRPLQFSDVWMNIHERSRSVTLHYSHNGRQSGHAVVNNGRPRRSLGALSTQVRQPECRAAMQACLPPRRSRFQVMVSRSSVCGLHRIGRSIRCAMAAKWFDSTGIVNFLPLQTDSPFPPDDTEGPFNAHFKVTFRVTSSAPPGEGDN